ncbi:hypothetical protein [Agromyces laixinhei]|uniref:hypothetical protein n=1 Tax=Agromyces laixinhei TaxID=2585717 RepID=UPI0012ED98EF|nr:hypothetical protein [Agromyces laixinhei]
MPEYLEAGLFAIDRDTRTVRGLLLPYGERSRLSISKTKPLTFNAGDVTVPRDPSIVGLNRMHDRFDPFGRADELDATDPRGVVATFRIADTAEGDEWLAQPGNLRRLSPEVRNIVRRDDGSATCELVGAALVDEGAFASAGLFAIDHEPEPAEESEEPEETPDPAPAEEDTEPEDPADQEEETVPEATVPNTLAGGTAATERSNTPMTASAMFAALSSISQGRADGATIGRVQEQWRGGEAGLFALSDVDYDGASGVGSVMTQPAWLDEVTDGVEYQPIYADLFEQRPLTSLAMAGWGWVTPPEGAEWAGNKADVHSNAPVVEPITQNASRWAGGHDHAREHVDFGTPGYFESYWAKMTESFLKWLDTKVITSALAAASVVEADDPAGFEIGAGLSALIDGAAEVVTKGRIPTFGLLPVPAWKSTLKTPNSAVLGYLDAQLGFDKGTLERNGFVIRPSADLGVGVESLVGARTSGRTYKLSGAPIRAEALDIARGGIDTGAFGYGGWMPVNDEALVKVTTYTP